MEVVGFSPSGREVVLKVRDANQGTLFQVRDAKKNRVLSSHPYQENSEKRAWRRLTRKHQLVEDFSLSSKNPRGAQTLMTGVEGRDLVVYLMDGERIQVYERVPLLKPRDGSTPKAFVKQAVWGPKGRHVVIIYHQQLRDLLEWEGDFVHSFKYRSYRLEGSDGAGTP